MRPPQSLCGSGVDKLHEAGPQDILELPAVRPFVAKPPDVAALYAQLAVLHDEKWAANASRLRHQPKLLLLDVVHHCHFILDILATPEILERARDLACVLVDPNPVAVNEHFRAVLHHLRLLGLLLFRIIKFAFAEMLLSQIRQAFKSCRASDTFNSPCSSTKSPHEHT